MRLAKKYAVPLEISLLYEFLNSADMRTYVEKGEQHLRADELGAPAQLEHWMRERGLLADDETVSATDHRRALELRSALRGYLQLSPKARVRAQEKIDALNKIAEFYPLVVQAQGTGIPGLQPAPDCNGLARVLAELVALGETGRLDRLKMCESDECHWIFFDRSKPGRRRWCSSLLCGNRNKTRDYRERLRHAAG